MDRMIATPAKVTNLYLLSSIGVELLVPRKITEANVKSTSKGSNTVMESSGNKAVVCLRKAMEGKEGNRENKEGSYEKSQSVRHLQCNPWHIFS